MDSQLWLNALMTLALAMSIIGLIGMLWPDHRRKRRRGS